MTRAITPVMRWVNGLGFARVVESALQSALDVESALLRGHPSFRWREHVAALQSDEAPANAPDYTQAATWYTQHVWVYKALKIWADSIAPLHIGVTRPSAPDHPDLSHPLALLLAYPNPTTPAADLWREWAINMGLGGESGFEVVRNKKGNPIELYTRAPVDFAVRPDDSLYRYNIVAEYVMFPNDKEASYNLLPTDFLHFKFHNPIDRWRGLAPLSAVRLGITTDLSVQTWGLRFFDNDARPDFAVVAPAGLTPTEREQILFDLRQRAGGPIVLENGVQDIKAFSFPRKDLEWLSQRQISRDEVGAVFGIPDEIMGYGRDTYENFDVAERVLWDLTLKALIQFRDERLTYFFASTNMLKPGERITTDLTRVWPLRRASQIQLMDARAYWLMGVPFDFIDTYLGLGVGPIPNGQFPWGAAPPSATSESLPQSPTRFRDRRRAALVELQEQELQVLRALRASRALGRGKQLDTASDPIQAIAITDDELAAQLATGEANHESLAALQERVIALYEARKGELK